MTSRTPPQEATRPGPLARPAGGPATNGSGAAREAKFGTLDDLAAPRHRIASDHAKTRDRWSREKKLAFKELAPTAVCIVATDGPVSVTTYDAGGHVTRRIGHNRGCWPVRLVSSGVWKDTVTSRYNVSPWHWTGMQIRTWTTSQDLALNVGELLSGLSDEAHGQTLENEFKDLGPDLQMEILEMQIHALGERYKLPVWDDDALSRYLDQLVARAEYHMRRPRNVNRIRR